MMFVALKSAKCVFGEIIKVFRTSLTVSRLCRRLIAMNRSMLPHKSAESAEATVKREIARCSMQTSVGICNEGSVFYLLHEHTAKKHSSSLSKYLTNRYCELSTATP